MTIGEALKQERQKLGMSKYEFSKGHVKNILLLQIILNIFLNAVYLFLTNFPYYKNYKRAWIINIVILLLILLFQLIGLKKSRFNKVFRLLSIIFLNYIILITYCDLFSHLADWRPYSTLLNITWAIGYLVILIPNIVVNFSSTKNKWLRFLEINTLFFSLLMSSGFSPVEEEPLSIFNEWLIGSLVFLILVPIILHGWGIKFEFSLKSFKNNKFQFLIASLLILFSIWILCVHVFEINNNSLIKLFTNFDFSLIDPYNSASYNFYQIIFKALNAGISEEIWRYLMIVTLGMILVQKSFQLKGSILISAIIFGLSHYINVFTVGWSLSAATMNFIASTAWGIIMAIVLLYTGKIWLGMLLHATHDFLAFSLTPLAVGNQVIEPWNWLNPTIILFLALVLFLIFTLPKLSQVMQFNLNRLLETQKQVKIS